MDGAAWLFFALAVSCLDFFYRDGAHRADFNTCFAAEAVFGTGRNGFVVFKVIDFSRTGVDTFLVALALVVINSNFKHGFSSLV